MGHEVTLGGDRLGSGDKQKVELHNYEMTSFNLEQDFKSTMAPGILYPFMKEIATNHGTFDIDMDAIVRTLPTKGPLFGSFKMQCDIFAVPMRLYNGILHNNPIKVGMNMDKIYLPKIRLSMTDGAETVRVKDANDDNWQINETALEKYLGLSGIGRKQVQGLKSEISRKFQCIPELAYYDIFKNYYANKQEENAYVITPGGFNATQLETEATNIATGEPIPISTSPAETGLDITGFTTNPQATIGINIKSNEIIDTEETGINLYGLNGSTETNYQYSINEIIENETFTNYEISEDGKEIKIYVKINEIMNPTTKRTDGFYISVYNNTSFIPEYSADIELTPFKLENIDDMRNALLSKNTLGEEFVIGLGGADAWGLKSGTGGDGLPYSTLIKQVTASNGDKISYNAFAQNGLVVKTYQSDLFNNWLETEYIEGENGINAISSVAVVGDKFTMDSLNLAEKIYEYLNRVLVAGGTYEDWQEATYGQGAIRKAETPMYVGGMSSEIMFEEVIATNNNGSGNQALGELGGRGKQTGIKGGNNIHIKCDEPSYIIGIVSLTPRICYSQGNDWDRTELNTMDDLHKPALDGIGFQDLIVEQMAWWNTQIDTDGVLHRDSAGKQIAWINYQTAIDKCFGDFAKQDGYGFMVLGRHYEHGVGPSNVKDLTTYIDPVKFNYAFAYSKLDAQNFWVQIHSKITARRKMAGQQIPNI